MGPVPDAVRDAAKAAFGAGPPEAVIADLVFDSLIDPGVDQAPPGRRLLRFEGPDGGAQLEVAEVGELVTVRGRLVPAAAALVEVRSKAPTFTVRADERGAFSFDAPAGLISLVATAEGRRSLQTAWLRL